MKIDSRIHDQIYADLQVNHIAIRPFGRGEVASMAGRMREVSGWTLALL